MRRTFIAVALASATLLCPALATADTGNQTLADSVATQLRNGGQLHDYEIGVKVNEGTVLLSGRVANQKQLGTALRSVSYMKGVTKVINRLTVASSKQPAAKAAPAKKTSSLSQTLKSLFAKRPTEKPAEKLVQQAQKVATSFQQAPVRQTSAMEMTAPMVMQDDMVPVARQMPQQMQMQQMQMQQQARPQYYVAQRPMPVAVANRSAQGYRQPVPSGAAQACYEQPCMPNYSWPSYAAYPNYAAVTAPRQYSATAFPYIGPFYPYPQVPLGWRKVSLEWDDGWWWIDFKDQCCR